MNYEDTMKIHTYQTIFESIQET